MASRHVLARITAPASNDTRIIPRIPATETASAWMTADAGEKMACVSPPVAMTNGARSGKNCRA